MPHDETLKTWNKIAATYQEKFMSLTLYDHTYDEFLASLQQGSRVLDVGCGPGNIAKYVLTRRQDLDVSGIDMAPNMIQLAAKNNPLGHFAVLNCDEIRTLARRFDGIICGFVIPYLSDNELKSFVADASALLVEDGIFYVSFVDGDPDESGMITNGQGDRTIFYYHRESDVVALLESNSLQLENRFYVDYPKGGVTQVHTILIARKSMPDTGNL